MLSDDLVPQFDPNAPVGTPEQTDNSARPDDGDQTVVSQEPESAYDPTGEPEDAS